MMSDTTTPVATEAGAEVEKEVPAGELTELARLEIRVGKILEVTAQISVRMDNTLRFPWQF